MAQTSWPFENIDTNETQFSLWARNIGEGVKGGPDTNELRVTGDDSGMQVRVAAGEALVRGHYYLNDSQATVTITPADLSNARIDTIVLELDPALNRIIARAIAGTPDNSPVPPTLTKTNAGIYQIALANVFVDAAATSILSGDVTDTRTFLSAQPALNPFLLMGG